MKSKTKNNIKLFLAGSLLAAALPVMALTGDTEKPVHIDSENQALDMQGNVATFTGNVIATQGTIKVTADKVVVTRPGGDSNKTIIDAYGNPATFYQMQDNGKPVQGHAARLHYELANDFIELTGNAFLQQQDSNVNGDRITYLVKAQKVQAFSSTGKRVTTVLVPSQLQDKNKHDQANKSN
ncbi:lipopolysaccharide ABC transporter substrate-binding protein LptA [Erwinia sp. OLTSP20]|uniref:lipopolysaccharide ABC transporter substrate-binding protein LptA n=1 Tax=unclassified Erwinia TaxID=2622719 RepID=UPI000C17A276|nr:MULTISPECIES: lipopolysaccharide ABC transporter substrate-binding protein LptA [unclassified Erwinia]PIJ51049.1 lipopolysaccharide ABC transporter substrate-binding protein LptA [Erwinia sp. OAMSP11]PIJ73683.1 lipopolysaccharide ABC transporter substrate-binding protein LptA [Erwinia sp. OLSSP12]PIJ83040.1 lipopolysaccharide ABC transporter substrate-binding protein LptA [Erwinia sp. OLCASP19]PIJ85639.1 lipopolysaccharide ABC transporter substrate-binding protein LptA [Erwinia sp. OLMTSP26]